MGYRPSTKWRSLWQTPLATVLTTTSCSMGEEISISSMVKGAWGSRNMAAFMTDVLSVPKHARGQTLNERAQYTPREGRPGGTLPASGLSVIGWANIQRLSIV